VHNKSLLFVSHITGSQIKKVSTSSLLALCRRDNGLFTCKFCGEIGTMTSTSVDDQEGICLLDG